MLSLSPKYNIHKKCVTRTKCRKYHSTIKAMTTRKRLCEDSIDDSEDKSSDEDDEDDEEDDFVELVENEDEDEGVEYNVVYL